MPWRIHHDSTRGNDLLVLRRAYPCARPLRAAASSVRIFARHIARFICNGSVRDADVLRPFNDPSESPPSPPRNSGFAPSAQPAKLHLPLSLSNNRRSTLWENPRRTHPYAYGSYGGTCPESHPYVLLNCLQYNQTSENCQYQKYIFLSWPACRMLCGICPRGAVTAEGIHCATCLPGEIVRMVFKKRYSFKFFPIPVIYYSAFLPIFMLL